MNADTFTVTIHSLSYGGRGVGRKEDGKVVFVPGVIPGETLLVRTDKEHSSYCTAEVVEILEGSVKRVAPECPVFSVCGGCDWQHISYPDQVSWKNIIFMDEITKSGHKGDFKQFQPVASQKIYGYRGHAVLQSSYDPYLTLGFFRKKSNDIVEIDRCPILNPRVQKIIEGLKTILQNNPLQGLSSLEIHAPQEEVILMAKVERANQRSLLKVMEKIYDELDVTGISFVIPGSRGKDLLIGQKFCRYSLDVRGKALHLSSTFGGFIQANNEVNSKLIEHVMELAEGSENILDLYSGSGNFSIPLSRVASRVVGIEKSRKLVSQGKLSTKKNSADNVRFLAMDAIHAVESARDELVAFDTIVLDPPREGAKDVARIIPDLNASRIIYISCNPSTLVRDLKPLIQAGYTMNNARLFDMFPQTYHIESVVCLER